MPSRAPCRYVHSTRTPKRVVASSDALQYPMHSSRQQQRMQGQDGGAGRSGINGEGARGGGDPPIQSEGEDVMGGGGGAAPPLRLLDFASIKQSVEDFREEHQNRQRQPAADDAPHHAAGAAFLDAVVCLCVALVSPSHVSALAGDFEAHGICTP